MKDFFKVMGLLLFVYCCNPKSRYTEYLMVHENGKIEEIDVSLKGEISSLISIKELFEDISYISLKTPDSLQLTYAAKIIEFQDKLIVLDGKKKILLAFELDGNFIGQVGNKGEGPEEYQSITDFDFDMYRNEIVAFSRADMSIFWFDKDLKFIEKKRINSWGNLLAILESGNIAIYSYMDNNNDPYNIRIYDRAGILVSKAMPYPQENGGFTVPDYSGFIRNNYYTYPYSSRVYKIDEENLNEYPLFEFKFPNMRDEKKKFDHSEFFLKPFSDEILGKFEFGKSNKEAIFKYSFKSGANNGFTTGILLSSGEAFGHQQLKHGAVGKDDIFVKLFFVSPYNLPNYSTVSGYYYVARDIESVAFFYDEIKNELKELVKSDPHLYDLLIGLEDIESPFIMRFKLIDRYEK
ncbi:6-bladed beta-propeller [Mongoliitalea daihaiensis]|uniref:6-bladed beta-propeller n=1 Tax=Mongoliitalea daihaiensis TaxID=2782006 RepID=UPI001F2D1C64|nr:6-bladed beta-propeller [Mongoliitalea daihaiensis]UJP64644.1 6-bladed beta-propeller [Mongoliitalea daihaiensis]